MTCGQQGQCCLPGNRVTADKKQISQPYQTPLQHSAFPDGCAQCPWCHRAGSAWVSLCCPVPKASGAAVPACWAQCSKDGHSNTWLRKVMTIHAVADPQGIFPFSCNFFSAGIITQHWKQGGTPLVASSGLRCLLPTYIHVLYIYIFIYTV